MTRNYSRELRSLWESKRNGRDIMFCKDCVCAGGCTSKQALQQCTAYPRAISALNTHFKYDSFRPGQLEAILPVLHGRDTFVRLPTGGGKSLCMFLVPLSHEPSTVGLVISPLIGLMDEQVAKLSKVGVKAVRAVSSNTDIYSCILSGDYRFVFMSPETATSNPWRKLFGEGKIAMVAIDEAHCISEWGEKFRTSFRQLGGLRALTTAPFMALTASAPPSVEADVKAILELRSCVMVTLPLDRPNIYVATKKKSSLSRDFGGIASSMRDCCCPEDFPKTLVFCKTKSQCVKVYNMFKAMSTHKSLVSMYHATLSEETKAFLYRHFTAMSSDLRCLVCTIAFGMGMDVSDVTRVVVYGLPDSISQYYQLIGRAGRAGQPSTSLLLYSTAEIRNCSDASLRSLCEHKENCRRQTLLRALGSDECSVVSKSLCCEICQPVCPYSALGFTFTSIVQETRKRRPRTHPVSADIQSSLESRLLAERDALIANNPALKMLPKSLVCPVSVIREISSRSKSIYKIEDISLFSCVRPEFHLPFFNAVVECIGSAPSAKRPCTRL